jgi:hypothetical protein
MTDVSLFKLSPATRAEITRGLTGFTASSTL